MGSNATPKAGAKYGRRLIPTLVDELAASKPDHVYASLPRNKDFTAGFDKVTSRDVARAVNRAAFWIQHEIGKSADFDTIAYLGPMDLRYFIIAIAASKVGYKTLLPSPRNSIEGHLALLKSTDCNILISPVETKVDHILSRRNMRHINVGALNDLLRDDFIEHYEYHKTFEEAARDPFIIVHTSGSTGLPKPIILYHGGVTQVDSQHLLPSLDGFEPQIRFPEASPRVFSTLPPFHVAGIIQGLLCALYWEETILWPPIGRPISADLFDDLLNNVSVDIVFLVPSTLEEISQSQASLEKLGRVKYARYAGGPLGKAAGDAISRYTRVLNVLGSSEAGIFPMLNKSTEDWSYFHFDPRLNGLGFREIAPGLYEQYFIRHESTDPFHWAFYTFPDRTEVSMNDVFSKHPSKPNLWLYEGRADDMIVFSNGEKLNPNNMEATLRSSPKVSGALVIGQGRFEATALLELKERVPNKEEGRKAVLEELSPYIIKANRSAPAFAKIGQGRVFFTMAGKPMLRTDKGTVKRRATTQAYEKEIDQFYADMAGLEGSADASQLDPRDQDAVRSGIRNILNEVEGLRDASFDQDLFAIGMDSLQVMNLVRWLRSSFRDHDGGVVGKLISPRTIYSNPNVLRLAASIQWLAEHGNGAVEGLETQRIDKMEGLLEKYSQGLPQPRHPTTPRQQQGLTIILTGSTGSLGSYLLDCLLANTQVEKVICLNRGADGETKQKNSNKSRGLTTEWGKRVQFLSTDLNKSALGLGTDEYNMLVEEASAIIHNQWQVDFNLNLDSFEPHIAGIRDLINLSNQSPNHPPILFTSSISTVDNWAAKHPGVKVPESAFYDFSIPAAMGYGESKYIAEQLLEKAATTSGVSAVICRVGQLAGPVVKSKGSWNKQEWLPSLIASSAYLGKIPTNLPGQDTTPWIPVDKTAPIILDLLFSSLPPLTHPHILDKIPQLITAHFAVAHNKKKTITPVPFSAWVSALKASASRTDDVAANPAIKLLGFFEKMATGNGQAEVELETAQTVRKSPAMRGLKAVGPGWMQIWLDQWEF